jgi:hypothetical protein
MKSLLKQKEVEIDKLPDNMTLGDLSDLLAYSNSKLILPGNEVIYTTPDNMQFKTYSEASNHISDLAKNTEDVDLSDISINNKNPQELVGKEVIVGDKGKSIVTKVEDLKDGYIKIFTDKGNFIEPYTLNNINNFIEKNKEYEQSKEIIEEWKKVNNIQYNPEEIYSRGQEFSSVVGAYSSFDVNLMMQNLLQHIEDNEKAGGQFAISAYTKPIDRQIGHLEGGGGKIKFKLYPQSEDILWAANTDVYSGSVWDASEKVNKDKKSELLGVSYTKYPSLRNVNSVQPNLAAVVDDLQHHHNELGIVLTGNNFRLEYDDNIPYQTKNIIDSINKILDQKYGQLVKPEIGLKKLDDPRIKNIRDKIDLLDINSAIGGLTKEEQLEYDSLTKEYQQLVKNAKGIQPTQTKDNLKKTIADIKFNIDFKVPNVYKIEDVPNNFTVENIKGNPITIVKTNDGVWKGYLEDGRFEEVSEETVLKGYNKSQGNLLTKEYTSQALVNTKIAKLKEVAKKYPRSLIRSEVKPIYTSSSQELYDQFEGDELPFQKIPSKEITLNINNQDIEKLSNLPTNIQEYMLSLSKEDLSKVIDVLKEYDNLDYLPDDNTYIDMLKCKI